MRAKSIPLKPSRFFLEASQSLPVRTDSVETFPDTSNDGVGTSESGGGEFDTCIVCNMANSSVSRCAMMDCPVRYHEVCLTPEYGGNEDLINPICPYCYYKITFEKSGALKKKAYEAEIAVSVYLNKEVKSGDAERQEGTGLSGEQELQGEKAAASSNEEQEEDRGKLETGTGEARETEEVNVYEDVEVLEDEEWVRTQNFQDDEDDTTAEVLTKVGTFAVDKGDVTLLLSLQEHSSGNVNDQDHQNEKERRIRLIKGKSRDVVEDEEMEDVEASEEGKRVASENSQDDEDGEESAERQTKVSTCAGEKGHDQEQHNDKERRKLIKGKSRDVVEDEEMEDVEASEEGKRVASENSQDDEGGEESAERQTKVSTCAGEKGHDQEQQNDKERRKLIKGKSRDMVEDEEMEDVEASEVGKRVASENSQDDEDDEESAEHQTKVSTCAGEKGHDQVQPNEERNIKRLAKFSVIDDEDDEESAEHQTKVSTGAEGKVHDQVQQNAKLKRRRLLKLSEVVDEVSSSKEHNEENGTEQISSSSSGEKNNQQSKPNAATKEAVTSMPESTCRKLPTWETSLSYKNQKRRILWTSKEEDMLKAGVLKYALEAKKNMPWRKILELGGTVFHESRTPSDLKDKWRNMLKAEAHTTEH